MMEDADVSKKRSGQLIVYERKRKNKTIDDNFVLNNMRDEKTIDDAFVLVNTRDDTLKPYNLKTISYNKLLKHQKEGIAWFWNKHCQLGNKRNGILGDDMGLGKTKLVCTFLAGLFKSGLIRSVLIIVPKILMSNWEKELRLEEFELGDKIASFDDHKAQKLIEEQHMGGTLKVNIKLMSYERMIKNDNILGQGKDWDYLIFDEAHYLKDPDTKRHESMSKIGTQHKILITGTPLENNLDELYHLYDIVYPGLLGEDLANFKELFANDINDANNRTAGKHQKFLGYKASQQIIELTKDFILRRTMVEANFNLPKKREVLVWLRLTNLQRNVYKQCLMIDDKGENGEQFAKMTVMKEICNDLCHLKKRAANPRDNTIAKEMTQELLNQFKNAMKNVEKENLSCKINFIAELVDDEQKRGNRILLFSESKRMLASIKEQLNIMNLKFYHIDGDTKDSLKTKYIEDFESCIDIDRKNFLLAKQVGGVGITLVKANCVILVDLSWNPSLDSQCVGRAHRIGQKREVIVYRLLTAGTIEEKIFMLQTNKNWLFKMITQDIANVKSYDPLFDDHEIHKIFKMPKDEAFHTSMTHKEFKIQQDKEVKKDGIMKSLQDRVIRRGAIGLNDLNLIFKDGKSILSSNSAQWESYVPKGREWGKRPRLEKRPLRKRSFQSLR